MRYIFIDESRITSGRFQLFGSLWLPRAKQEEFRKKFWSLWDSEFPTRRSELKWTKVSKGKIETYKKFIDLMAEYPGVDFRCVILDRHTIDYREYHDGDKDLGFYKFLFFFLTRNIEKDYRYRGVREPYQIYLDKRRSDGSIELGRLEDLKFFLNMRIADSCLDIDGHCVRSVEPVNSKESPEVQLVDLIMGAVGYTWEGFQTSEAKLLLIEHIENLFGLKLDVGTPYLTERINIWKFKLQDKRKSAPMPTPSEEG